MDLVRERAQRLLLGERHKGRYLLVRQIDAVYGCPATKLTTRALRPAGLSRSTFGHHLTWRDGLPAGAAMLPTPCSLGLSYRDNRRVLDCVNRP